MQPQQRERESMLNRAWEEAEGGYREVADRASGLYESAEHYTQEAPFTASLVSFGVGIGMGLLLAGLMVPQRRPRRWYDSYVGHDRAAEFEEALHRYLPESITRRMGV